MTFSGALHELRANPGAYADYVKKSIENVTFAADEIERDLHRALPEVSFHGDFRYSAKISFGQSCYSFFVLAPGVSRRKGYLCFATCAECVRRPKSKHRLLSSDEYSDSGFTFVQ